MQTTIGRIGELELRFNSNSSSHLVESLEIVNWTEQLTEDHEEGISNETIAMWRYDGLYSSPDLVFVGQRPFSESVNKEAFWILAEKGNIIANSIWDIEIQALRMKLSTQEENPLTLDYEEEDF